MKLNPATILWQTAHFGAPSGIIGIYTYRYREVFDLETHASFMFFFWLTTLSLWGPIWAGIARYAYSLEEKPFRKKLKVRKHLKKYFFSHKVPWTFIVGIILLPYCAKKAFNLPIPTESISTITSTYALYTIACLTLCVFLWQKIPGVPKMKWLHKKQK